MTPTTAPAAPPPHDAHHGSTSALALGALGIVFGDIGTSPLYAFKECVRPEHGGATAGNVLGVLSLIFWSLMMVVTVKYLTFIMRADNRGEGGILALLALIPEEKDARSSARIGWVALLVLAGAALLYGDGIITPAISVLSAMEGLEVATPALKPVVIPLTCAVLFVLFLIQKRGTAGVGRLFGPVMLVWFSVIAVMGLVHLVKNPAVLAALSPVYGVRYFIAHGPHGLAVLGSVVLAVTGGEALYADMGHFGARPIRLAWIALVLPALVLCYFGQGALLLADPHAAENPFYAMVGSGIWTYALVALSAAATVIASQALISGAFSLTHQAVQLGYFPRVTVTHTSHHTEGQIYVPEINWGLMLACLALVVSFRESSRLASAYGIAVSGTMAITSIVYFVVTQRTWRWPLWSSAALLVLFLAFDIPFLLANVLKFMDGGYIPILVGLGFFVVMVDWKRGKAFLAQHMAQRSPPWEQFLRGLDQLLIARAPGAAAFMSSNRSSVPAILVHHVQRIRVLHEVVLLVTVVIEHVPVVAEEQRLELVPLEKGFYRVVAHYGFTETPVIPDMLREAALRHQLPVKVEELTYFLGLETFVATEKGNMGIWGESLFGFLSRNARSATAYFGIPPEQVVELGAQIDL